MINFQKKLLNRDNKILIQSFLSKILNNQFIHSDNSEFLSNNLVQHLKCWGFPEFNPTNRAEFGGFINALHDVFDQLDCHTDILFSVDAYVLTRIHIKGKHSEEFMGLPATGGALSLNAILLFKLQENCISEMWMYNKKVSVVTLNGNVYQLKTPG